MKEFPFHIKVGTKRIDRTVRPGQTYEAKEEGRGMYVVLHNANGRWRCLVLIEDCNTPHELVGSITVINEKWLQIKCTRLG